MRQSQNKLFEHFKDKEYVRQNLHNMGYEDISDHVLDEICDDIEEEIDIINRSEVKKQLDQLGYNTCDIPESVLNELVIELNESLKEEETEMNIPIPKKKLFVRPSSRKSTNETEKKNSISKRNDPVSNYQKYSGTWAKDKFLKRLEGKDGSKKSLFGPGGYSSYINNIKPF
jgi:hypothetical protein